MNLVYFIVLLKYYFVYIYTLCMIDNIISGLVSVLSKWLASEQPSIPKIPLEYLLHPEVKGFFIKPHKLNTFHSANVNFFLISHLYYSNWQTFKSVKLLEYNCFLIRPLELLLSSQGTTVHTVHFPNSYTKTHSLPMHK